MRTHGLNGLKAHIRRTIGIGNTFADLIRGRPDLFEIISWPAFCLTVFRIKSPKATATVDERGVVQPEEACNNLTKEVYELVNSRGEIFITSSVVAGITAIRVVSANAAAEEGYIRWAFEILVKTTEEVLSTALVS